MNILYGIEPDLCIQNPNLITEYQKDIILPKYFYTQLNYLKDGNFNQATEAAQEIIYSLSPFTQSNLLTFQNKKGGFIYFIDEDIAKDNQLKNLDNFDLSKPLDRYFLSLFKIAELLQSEIHFCTNSLTIIYELKTLNFVFQTVEEFRHQSKLWLRLETILSIQNQLKPSIIDCPPQIIWKEDQSEKINQENFFIWTDRF